MYIQKFRLVAFLSLVALNFCPPLKAQEIPAIAGKVISATTKEAILYATIYNKRTQLGTISNSNGLFTLQNTLATDTINIRYIGYETLVILAAEIKEHTPLKLVPKTELLAEVVISTDNTYLYSLLYNTRNKASKQRKTAKTYFLLETERNNKQTELIEAFYNSEFEGYNLVGNALKEGRIYSDLKSGYFISTGTSKAILMQQLFSKSDYFPTSPFQLSKRELQKRYNLTLESVLTNSNNEEIYKVAFSPKKDSTVYFAGYAYINTKREKLSKVFLYVINTNRHPFSSISEDSKITQFSLQISKNFENLGDDTFLKSIDFDYTLSLESKDSFGVHSTSKIKTNSVIYAYDYQNTFNLPLYKYPDLSYRHPDYYQILSAPYNLVFWDHQEFTIADSDAKNQEFKTYAKQLSFDQKIENRLSFKGTSFVPWSKNRVNITDLPEQKPIKDNLNKSDVPKHKYKLAVQIYVDANMIGDTLNLLSMAIFDPIESFYDYTQDQLSRAFINIYFDLMEIKRRELHLKLQKEAKTPEDVERIYHTELEKISDFSHQFFKEIQRGKNQKAYYKYNTMVVEELGIDNNEIYQPHSSLF